MEIVKGLEAAVENARKLQSPSTATSIHLDMFKVATIGQREVADSCYNYIYTGVGSLTTSPPCAHSRVHVS